jgi:hypothetical protein
MKHTQTLPKRFNWKARLKLLEELRDDVERWREGGGDPRDLRYIIDTLEKLDEQDESFGKPKQERAGECLPKSAI